jgi:putative component of membrane protein insertase Oxa1/YidC/SpoIIIJ protein YidD
MVLALVSTAVLSCGVHSAGPTAPKAPATGAACMLRAFHNHCTPATYELDVMGVDTINRRSFRIARCHVVVTEGFRVVPRPMHTTLRAVCSGLRRTATDIVATGCTRVQVARSYSLTH